MDVRTVDGCYNGRWRLGRSMDVRTVDGGYDGRWMSRAAGGVCDSHRKTSIFIFLAGLVGPQVMVDSTASVAELVSEMDRLIST
eukprot:1148257-Pyramimonas_sp.AAC.1